MKKRLLLFVLLFVSAAALSQTVYKTPSGKKYHLENCHTVKNTSEALSISEAIDLGLDACKICKPGSGLRVQNFKTDNQNAVGEKQQTTQCSGKTKKGTRCKHRTKIANGYCFQHQP